MSTTMVDFAMGIFQSSSSNTMKANLKLICIILLLFEGNAFK